MEKVISRKECFIKTVLERNKNTEVKFTKRQTETATEKGEHRQIKRMDRQE